MLHSVSCVQLCHPMDCSPPGFSVLGIIQARILKWVPFSSPEDLPDPGIELRSPILQLDYLPCEPPGKPKNTGVGSLSLLQEIFPTQGSNPGLPHCFRILYHLRTREAPNWNEAVVKMRAVADFIFLAPKSLQVVTAALKLKDSSSLQGQL